MMYSVTWLPAGRERMGIRVPQSFEIEVDGIADRVGRGEIRFSTSKRRRSSSQILRRRSSLFNVELRRGRFH